MQSADLIYQQQILPHVSRTFALTIPQLPDDLRDAVANAYLLCRITDTIEDEASLDTATKQVFSQQFAEVVAGKTSAEQFAQSLTPLLSTQTLEAERDLVANTATVVRLTHSLNQQQQTALTRCVQTMAEGMNRFQQHSDLNGLATQQDLDHYCYYVAGVVGEMLTDLFCDYDPAIQANAPRLQQLAVSFGQSLQMTNILKDIWDDQQRGVCWLPQEIFTRQGFALSDLAKTSYQHDEGFAIGLRELIGIAHTHLHNALRYVLLIPQHQVGIRRFCLWALGMAILTLRKINRNLDFRDSNQVKISRRDVKATILLSNLFAQQDWALKGIFKLLSQGLPAQQEIVLSQLSPQQFSI